MLCLHRNNMYLGIMNFFVERPSTSSYLLPSLSDVVTDNTDDGSDAQQSTTQHQEIVGEETDDGSFKNGNLAINIALKNY